MEKDKVYIKTNSQRTGYITAQRTDENGIMLYYLYMDDKIKYISCVDDGYIHIDEERINDSDIDYLNRLAISEFAGKAMCNSDIGCDSIIFGTVYKGLSLQQGIKEIKRILISCVYDYKLFEFDNKKRLRLNLKNLNQLNFNIFLVRDNRRLYTRSGNLPFGGTWQRYYKGNFLKDAEKLAGKQIYIA